MCNNLNGDALEIAADELLKQHRALGRDGVRTEAQLQRIERDRQQISIDTVFARWLVTPSGTEAALWQVAWTEIRDTAHKTHCTARQIKCLEWRRLGMSYQEIADEMALAFDEICANTVRNDINAAKEAIEVFPAFGIYDVMAEVFRMSIAEIRAILWD